MDGAKLQMKKNKLSTKDKNRKSIANFFLMSKICCFTVAHGCGERRRS